MKYIGEDKYIATLAKSALEIYVEEYATQFKLTVRRVGWAYPSFSGVVVKKSKSIKTSQDVVNYFKNNETLLKSI